MHVYLITKADNYKKTIYPDYIYKYPEEDLPAHKRNIEIYV